MNILKQYKTVLIIVVPVLVLVIFRSIGLDHFKPDARRWAEPSVMRSNLILQADLESMPGEKLLINLGEDEYISLIKEKSVSSIHIKPDVILSKSNLKTIKKHDGPVVIYSPEPALAAKAWMVLSQMGFNNIYILTTDKDNDSFKYEFRPDTLTRPEL